MSSAANGEGGSMSFADQLRLKHADITHNPTVEDVEDEEDVAHPPPAMANASNTPGGADEPVSETAMGKKKAQDSAQPTVSKSQSHTAGIDTKSETAFPSLGGGPKPRTSGPVAPAWGAKKGNSGTNGAGYNTNGHGQDSAAPDLGRPLVVTTPLAHASPNQPRGMPHQAVSMPGKHTESVVFAASQILKRQELKKPLPEVLRDINKRSKATVTMRPGPNGAINFEGTGPIEAVRQALKDVAKEVGSKQAIKVPIPASARPHIIGRQGATVLQISKRTGAHIQVPKTQDLPYPVDDDDSASIDVLIEGDAVAAEMARREIQSIVNERSATMNLRVRDIPAELYPFLAGPHNSGVERLQNGRSVEIKIPHYYAWTHQPPPQPQSHNSPPEFVSHPSSHIQISGDRLAVLEAKAELERQVEQLRRQITLSQIAINRGQHQFIVGHNGAAVHDLLKETGCAVILPPESDDSEMLTVSGPRSHIERGLEEVMNLATSMQMANVNIGHQRDQNHARALTQYLQQRRAIAQLEKLHDSRIVLPKASDGPVTWEVYSREGKNTIRARSDIMKIVSAYPPARFRHLELDPFFHEHLREQHMDRLRREHGVHMLLPPMSEQSHQLVIVFEGLGQSATMEPSRQPPTQDELRNFENALRKAEEEILSLSHGHQPIAVKEVEVPPKFHDKVRKFVRVDQQNLPDTNIPIQLLPGNIGLANGKGGQPNEASSHKQKVSLRGPGDRLDDFTEKILEFIEAEKRDELERGFTLSFDFPQKYANFLIGRRGENINKLREEFDVEIQVNDGKVELKGPKAKAEAAKTRILAMARKLEDEATHVLKIQPQYHRELIGSKGSQVNRLQDRYNVRVQFPRSAPASQDNDSVVDGSDAGGARHGRSNQAPDEVIVRGPKKGADAARDEILGLLQYNIDNSHSSVVSVAQSQVPSLIGQGGKEMENIRQTTGARIDVPNSSEGANSSGRVDLRIKGTKKQVEEAKKLLEQRAKVFDSSITKTIDVDKKLHKSLIGGGGASIRKIVMDAGGSDDRRELARTVRFPQQDSADSSIRVEGNKAVVEKIIAAIEAFVGERENQVTETMEVPPQKHRLLIGSGGETRRALESRFKVNIDIPKQTVQGAARSQVKLVGQEDNIQEAKAHIMEMVKENEGETVQVPRALHHIVSNNGTFFRNLKNNHKVLVDHAGQQPPPKPASSSSTRANGGANAPLITDDSNAAADAHSWVVMENASAEEEGDIPWILKGGPENVGKAKALLRTAIDQARLYTSTGFLILPDPSTYGLVIGPGGSQINSIREQTGCKINVPKNQARAEAIEIIGGSEGVEQAKDLILEVVRNGRGNNRS